MERTHDAIARVSESLRRFGRAGRARYPVSASLAAMTVAAAFQGAGVAANAADSSGMKGLEVVFVLDVTGSMFSNYSTGERRIESMRDATLELVDILFEDDPAPELMRVAIVPYNTTVNIGTDMHAFVTDTGLDANGMPTADNPFNQTTWFGCVQTRRNDNDLTDIYVPGALDGTGEWPAYRWPIEPDRRSAGYTYNYCETRADNVTGDYYRYEDPLTDFEADEFDTWFDASLPPNLVSGLRRYDRDTDGPNKGCPGPLLPLTNDRAAVWNYLQNDLTVVGGNGTMTATGMNWGWRVISPEPPFDQGQAYDDDGWEKAIIVLTDGRQVVSQQHSRCDNATSVTLPLADQPPLFGPWRFDPDSRNMDGLLLGNGAVAAEQREGPDYRWSAYGYLHPRDSRPLGDGNIQTILETRLVETCDAIKAVQDPVEGGSAINIFAITFGDDIYPGDSVSATMAYCTSDPQQNYFHAPNAQVLRDAFGEIFHQLTQMRTAQ